MISYYSVVVVTCKKKIWKFQTHTCQFQGLYGIDESGGRSFIRCVHTPLPAITGLGTYPYCYLRTMHGMDESVEEDPL